MNLMIVSRTTLLLIVLALNGCVANKPLVTTPAVGPMTAVGALDAKRGTLIVYSGWDRFDTLDSGHQKHTAYTVRPEGCNAIHVRNRQGSFGGEPETVALPPGKYLIEARATNVGPVHVPVIIRGGKTTAVYLDGVTAPSAPWTRQEATWIRQPNGLIVGWADTTGTP